MKSKSRPYIARFAAIASAILLASTALNFGVITRRAKAFAIVAVTNTNDNGPGSLRQAVLDAASGDTIDFNLTLPATITLASGEIAISQNLTITGPGANLLTISGNSSSRVFNVNSNLASLALSGVTIANGFTSGIGAGIISDFGGGLSVVDCSFAGNFTESAGGAIGTNIGNLVVSGCAFTGNTGSTSGAIVSTSNVLTISNSTFNGNSANVGGGGALGLFGGANTIVNCTIAGNSAVGAGGAIAFSSPATLNLVNTIIAGNSGGDCVNSGGTITTNSHNLIQDGSCSPLLSGDPKLGALQNNGGQTPTVGLLTGSPAIDAGDDSVLGSPSSLSTDQRGAGFPRKAGAHVDIGAFEVQPPPPPTFDTCLKDNSTGNWIQWNSVTGQYKFTRCSDSFTLNGTGSVGTVGGIRSLTDVKSDRNIHAGFNPGQLTGSAVIYLQVTQGVFQQIHISDTNPSVVCKC